MNLDKIKDKFSRIFKKKKFGPRNPKLLDKIYEIVKKSEKSLRIKEISEETGIKENTVRTYLKYLEQDHYIKRIRKYSPPFLIVESYKSNPEFIYGKENRDKRSEEEKNKLLEETQKINLNKETEEQVKTLKGSKEYNAKLLKIHNQLAELLWKKRILDVSKINIGSAANRYKI